MMQALACFSVCVRDGRMTREQALHMMRQIIRFEFEEADPSPLVERFKTDPQRRPPSK